MGLCSETSRSLNRGEELTEHQNGGEVWWGCALKPPDY